MPLYFYALDCKCRKLNLYLMPNSLDYPNNDKSNERQRTTDGYTAEVHFRLLPLGE